MTRTERVLRVAAVTATLVGLTVAFVEMAFVPSMPIRPVLESGAVGFVFGVAACVILYAYAEDRKVSAAAHTYRRQDAVKRASGRAA
jgi:hypothetical protein